MLVRTILLPYALAQQGHYGMALRLLQDLEKYGVILVDNRNCIRDALDREIENWPQDREVFRYKARKIITQLAKKQRFVEVPLNDRIRAMCRNESCQHCIKIAEKCGPTPVVLVSQDCSPCAERQLAQVNNVKVIDVTEYSAFDLFPHEYRKSKGEWTQKDFEGKILIPLFKDAKHIKIYDRWIGRSVLQENHQQYRLTLEWMVDVFIRETRWGVNGEFEVYCGLKIGSLSPPELRKAVTKLRQFETIIKQKYRFQKFKLIIKKEEDSEMPHGRYLLTNQVGIFIDPGFNLLYGNRNSRYGRNVNGFYISYCPKPEGLEAEVDYLDDFD